MSTHESLTPRAVCCLIIYESYINGFFNKITFSIYSIYIIFVLKHAVFSKDDLSMLIK